MLPSSHNSASISPGPETFGSEAGFGLFPLSAVESTQQPSALPSSTTSNSGSQTAASAHALAEAFATFVSTSTRLESAYRELQSEVAGLRVELEDRNAALKESLSENQRVRKALQQIVDSMPCGVIVVTRNGELTTVNPEASRMFALSGSELHPRSLANIEKSLGSDHVLTNLSNRDAEAEQEFCWESPAGERWLHVIARQITNSESDVATGLDLFILRDITAQKREEIHREAARNATVLAEITTMLAHEIRNPLASLELFANLIEQDAAGRDEWIANLRAGIRTLSGTVNNVLSFHDAGKLQLVPLELNELVESTVRFAKPLVDQAGASLLWCGGMLQIRILGSHSALQQVLLNLVRNAVRHTDAGGSITLTLEQKENEVLLHCTDTGSGVPPDLMAHIFEPGFSGAGDSPGLGLTVCQRMIKQHNGAISVTNVPGSGARFTLAFPGVTEGAHRL